MRVTICGHASLYIETADQRIMIDPCFSDTLINGTLTYYPSRVFDIENLPDLTVLILTHAHFDHFHPETLEKLARELPVITTNEPKLLKQLQQMGFIDVTVCQPWQAIALGQTYLLPTPSDHEEPEFGLLIGDPSGRFWHMADAEVTVEIGERITREYGSIDLISTKYQPVVRASMGYLHGMGAMFDREGVVDWLETACACNPALIFPYAAGLCFSGRHAWFNRYAFPLSADETVHLLQRRLGSTERAITVHPGDIIELQVGQHPQRYEQSSNFVREQPSPKLVWEPVDLTTLTGLSTPEDRRILKNELEAILTGSLISWLKQEIKHINSIWASFHTQEVIWQLVVHTGNGERLNYALDFRSQDFIVLLGEHPEANFFTHIAGQALYDVIINKIPGLIFWLAGEVRSYEKVICLHNGRFKSPEWPKNPEDFPPDPLTYYLRHFGTEKPQLNQQINLSNTQSLNNNIGILTRLGANEGVIAKKVLLAYLAVKEAERLGMEITDAEIQAVSDSLRQEFGLQEEQNTEQWLQAIGLSFAAYSSVMRDFTSVFKVQQHYADAIELMLTNHRLLATALSNRPRQKQPN
jgi:L-ascorbate metabolism protein UlaG (beta-lactamase superfamily)